MGTMDMDFNRISYDEYLTTIKKFILISYKINDNWKLHENDTNCNTYIKKELFKELVNCDQRLTLKAEYIVSYNISYGVPMFSFNYWYPSGVLLTLDEIKNISLIK